MDGLLVLAEVDVEDVFGRVLVEVVLAVSALNHDGCFSQLHVFVPVEPCLYQRLRKDHLPKEDGRLGRFGESLEVLLHLPEVFLPELVLGVEVGSHDERLAADLREEGEDVCLDDVLVLDGQLSVAPVYDVVLELVDNGKLLH